MIGVWEEAAGILQGACRWQQGDCREAEREPPGELTHTQHLLLRTHCLGGMCRAPPLI